MEEEIELFLPWPPSVNNYYSHSRFGVRISKKGRLYREAVADALNEQMHRLDIDAPINLEVILHPPDRRRRDLDNHMKAMLDACTVNGLWVDDALIDQLSIFRGQIIKHGGVIIRLNDAGPVLPFPSELLRN